MSKFLVLYQSSVSASEQMASATPEQAESGMNAWMEWARGAGDAVVDLGAPLGEAEEVGGDSGSSRQGHTTGFSILQADSMQAAVELMRDHPHLHTPGDSSIRVLEFLQLPGA